MDHLDEVYRRLQLDFQYGQLSETTVRLIAWYVFRSHNLIPEGEDVNLLHPKINSLLDQSGTTAREFAKKAGLRY